MPLAATQDLKRRFGAYRRFGVYLDTQAAEARSTENAYYQYALRVSLSAAPRKAGQGFAAGACVLCVCRAIMCQHDIDTDLDADVNSDINTDLNTDVYTDGVACPTEDPEYSPD